MTPDQLTALKADLGELQRLGHRSAWITLDNYAELITAAAENNRRREMLSRICREAFGYDDTISLESFDDYVIRQVAKLRAALQSIHATTLDFGSQDKAAAALKISVPLQRAADLPPEFSHG